MPRKTNIELERAAAAKAMRTAIRLKYSLAADREINDTVWDELERFDEALANGGEYHLELSEIVRRLERG